MERFLPVVTIREISDADRILPALAANGIHTAEITFRTDCAAEAIRYACKRYPEMKIGAGTVINREQCLAAADAGAKFIVSPGFSDKVAEVCRDRNIPYYPGCVTPTEMMRALDSGIRTVKFFPAQIYGGTAALKALAAPFPQLRFIPTGGIDRNNIGEYLELENVEAVGGSFFVADALKHWNEMEKNG